MLIFESKYNIRYGEKWFEEEKDKVLVDILNYHQINKPIKRGKNSDFYTILINLDKNREEIFNGFKKDTRYEIRRAERDNLFNCEFWDQDLSKEVYMEFCDFYDSFAVQKGLSIIERSWLERYINNKQICISKISLKDGTSITWHLYLCHKERVRLLYSASLYRNTDSSYKQIVGRANRYLHWQDIIWFKGINKKIYDFGGWYDGKEDKEKLLINKFKEEFGGEIIRNYNCELGVTIKGKIYLFVRDFIKNKF